MDWYNKFIVIIFFYLIWLCENNQDQTHFNGVSNENLPIFVFLFVLMVALIFNLCALYFLIVLKLTSIDVKKRSKKLLFKNAIRGASVIFFKNFQKLQKWIIKKLRFVYLQYKNINWIQVFNYAIYYFIILILRYKSMLLSLYYIRLVLFVLILIYLILFFIVK